MRRLLVAVLFGLAVLLPASSAHAASSGVRPAATGWYADGTIRPVGNGHLCLTRTDPTHDKDPMHVYDCVPRDPFQYFYLTRTGSLGQMAAGTDYVVGQEGLFDTVVRTFDYQFEYRKGLNWLIRFTPYENGWLLDTVVWRICPKWPFICRVERYVTVPSYIKRGVIPLWLPPKASGGRVQQEYILPTWHEQQP